MRIFETDVPNRMTLKDAVRALESAGVECGWADRTLARVDSVDLRRNLRFLMRPISCLGTLHVVLLDARGSSISDSTLACIRHINSLEWLCLRCTAVTDEGLRHLEELVALQRLDLLRTSVRGPG